MPAVNIFLVAWCAFTLGGNIVGWKICSKGPITFIKRGLQAMFLVCGVIATVNIVHTLLPAFPLARWEATSIFLEIGAGLPLWMWQKVLAWDTQPPSLLAALGWVFLGIPLLGFIASMSLIAGLSTLLSL